MQVKKKKVEACAGHEHGGAKRMPSVSPAAIERAARLFRAIGEPSRLRLLAILAQGEACVTELALSEGEEMSAVSQRLRVLRTEDLVVRRRKGKHINYALADQHIVDLVFNALAHASETPPQIPTQGEQRQDEPPHSRKPRSRPR